MENDLFHKDIEGANHSLFSDGLKKSLFNYMHGVGFEMDLSEWFDSKMPPSSIPPSYIERCIENEQSVKENGKLIWLGTMPLAMETEDGIELVFHTKTDSFTQEL